MTTVLNLTPITTLTKEQFYRLCQANPDIKLERSPQGELIIMTPVGGESGNREANLIGDLIIWNRQSQLGEVFSSSTVFSLPGGGDRSPDVAWVSSQRWQALSQGQRDGFPPLCPDFVIELRSRTDKLKPLQEKMQEYLASGLRLGWLINPQDSQVEIYRPGQPVEILTIPVELSGEEVLPGFILHLTNF
jgi:Uma2 family endonuclease